MGGAWEGRLGTSRHGGRPPPASLLPRTTPFLLPLFSTRARHSMALQRHAHYHWRASLRVSPVLCALLPVPPHFARYAPSHSLLTYLLHASAAARACLPPPTITSAPARTRHLYRTHLHTCAPARPRISASAAASSPALTCALGNVPPRHLPTSALHAASHCRRSPPLPSLRHGHS